MRVCSMKSAVPAAAHQCKARRKDQLPVASTELADAVDTRVPFVHEPSVNSVVSPAFYPISNSMVRDEGSGLTRWSACSACVG